MLMSNFGKINHFETKSILEFIIRLTVSTPPKKLFYQINENEIEYPE